MRPFLGHVAVAAVLGALTLELYASTADFPFVFDDFNNIRDNPHIRAERLSWDALWRASIATTPTCAACCRRCGKPGLSGSRCRHLEID